MSAVLAASPVAAQDPSLDVSSVRERARKGYEPHGIRAGSYILTPSVSGVSAVDNNVFASSGRTMTDYIFEVRPELVAKSQWSRHSLDFQVASQHLLFDQFSDESRSNYMAGTKAVIDVDRDTKILAIASFTLGHEDRGSGASFARFDKPVEYERIEGNVAIERKFGRFWTQLGVGLKRDDYKDSAIAGVVQDQDYRDGLEREVVARVGYEIGPKTSVFVEGAHFDKDYRDDTLDVTGYRALGGVRWDLTRLVRGEIAGGLIHFRPEVADIGVDTYTYRAKVQWDPTNLVSIMFYGNRDVGVTLDGAPRLKLQSEVGFRVDYELLRNFILSGKYSYAWSEVEGTGRRDVTQKTEFGSEYLLNRNASVFASFSYTDFTTTAALLDYNKAVVATGIKLQY